MQLLVDGAMAVSASSVLSLPSLHAGVNNYAEAVQALLPKHYTSGELDQQTLMYWEVGLHVPAVRPLHSCQQVELFSHEGLFPGVWTSQGGPQPTQGAGEHGVTLEGQGWKCTGFNTVSSLCPPM